MTRDLRRERVRARTARTAGTCATTSRSRPASATASIRRPRELNGQQVAPTVNLGAVVRPARRRTCSTASRRTQPDDHVRARRAGTTARASTRGTRTTSRRASSAAWTPNADLGRARRLRHRLRPRRRPACHDLRQRRLVRPVERPRLAVRRQRRDQPGGPFHEHDTMPATYPDAPPAGFPATPTSSTGTITSSIDQYADDALLARVQHHRRQGARQELRHRSRLRRPPRPRPAGPPRHRDAAEPDRPGVRHELLHGGEAARATPTTPAGGDVWRRSGRFPTGRTCSRTRRSTASSATQNMAARVRRNAPDYITALYNIDKFCAPACSRLRAVRLLRRAVRLARRTELARPFRTTTRMQLDAPAPVLQRRTSST